jgi:ABC-2 type transport system permease protein
MSTFIIARLTFREAARRRVLLAALLLGLLFLAVYGIGMHYMVADMNNSGIRVVNRSEIYNFLLMAGLYVVNFLTVMMTVLTSVDTLSGEVASGTIHTLVSKPIRRWEVVAGKWLGFSGMLALYLLLMGGGVLLLIWVLTGYYPQHPETALLLMLLNAFLLLSVSLFGGASFSTLTNGVLVFGLYGVAFIGGWLEQIGTMLPDPTAGHTLVNIGIITSLIMPSEALWRRAAYTVQSPLVAALGFSPFTSRSVPSPIMIFYAVAYLVLALFLAVRRFQQRDL